jgi:threonine/homoserine/homoserine lactone efflux protein
MTTALAALLIFLFPLAYSPGPGNMVFAAMGARHGVWGTWRASLGYHAATWAVTLTIGLGFDAALVERPAIARTVQVLGALYVLWLAARLWRAGAVAPTPESAPAMGFFGGAVLLLFNPKAYMIIALMFTQFAQAPGLGTIGVATVFTLNNMLAFALWAAVGATLTRLWSHPDAGTWLNRGLAVMLATVALWMALG